jgi:hypothetical protein
MAQPPVVAWPVPPKPPRLLAPVVVCEPPLDWPEVVRLGVEYERP